MYKSSIQQRKEWASELLTDFGLALTAAAIAISWTSTTYWIYLLIGTIFMVIGAWMKFSDTKRFESGIKSTKKHLIFIYNIILIFLVGVALIATPDSYTNVASAMSLIIIFALIQHVFSKI